MKTRYLRLKQWLLLTVLGALGAAGCQSHKQIAEPEGDKSEPELRERDEIRLMYGVPTMDYSIRGQVRDEKGKPVRDVRVSIVEHGIEATVDGIEGDPERVQEYLENTSVKTDKKGRFELKGTSRPWDEMRVLVRDVDGAANGDLKNRLVEVKVTPEDIDNSKAEGMRVGTFNKKVDVTLESK